MGLQWLYRVIIVFGAVFFQTLSWVRWAPSWSRSSRSHFCSWARPRSWRSWQRRAPFAGWQISGRAVCGRRNSWRSCGSCWSGPNPTLRTLSGCHGTFPPGCLDASVTDWYVGIAPPGRSHTSFHCRLISPRLRLQSWLLARFRSVQKFQGQSRWCTPLSSPLVC